MENISPLITVVIPLYNREKLIGMTLDCLLEQSYANWECIIVDDGSIDNSETIINKYKNKDQRFHFVKRNRAPKGASTCRNIGVRMASGEYIIFLDSDDLLIPTTLENRINNVILNPNYDFWVFKTGIFDNIIGDSKAVWNILNKDIDDLQRFLLQDAPWHTSGPLWRKETITSLGGFDETAICWQDWELHVRSLNGEFSFWKDGSEIIDSYYRDNKKDKKNTISGKQTKLEHILFRTELFDKLFDQIIIKDNRSEIKKAFAVLYFRNICDLHGKQLFENIKWLTKSLHSKKIFSYIELKAILFLSVRISNKKNSRRWYKYTLKLLKLLNSYVFNNKVRYTFQK